jgi:hypothetical protein
MCTSFPRRSTHTPSFSASMGHVSEDGVGVGVGVGGGGHAFRPPWCTLGLPPPRLGGRVTGGSPVIGGRVTGAPRTGGSEGRGTEGSGTGSDGSLGTLTGGKVTGGRVTPPPPAEGEPVWHELHAGCTTAISLASARGDEESASMASTSSAESLVDSILSLASSCRKSYHDVSC